MNWSLTVSYGNKIFCSRRNMRMNDEWINIEDEKPKLGINYRYLFLNGKNEVTYGYAYDWEPESNRYVWINDMDRETNEIATHWMPLPEAPQE